MNIGKNTDKKLFKTVALLILLTFALFNFSQVKMAFLSLLNLITPFLIGGLIAIFISVPLKFIEKLLRKTIFKYKYKQAFRAVAILITLLLVIAVTAFVFMTVIPQLASAVVSFVNKLPNVISDITSWLEEVRETDVEFVNSIGSRLIEFTTELQNNLENNISRYLLGGFNIVTNTLSAIVTGFLAFVFAIYLLFYKETFKKQIERFLYAFFSADFAESVLLTGKRAADIFSSFLAGTFMEAVIFGFMSFGGMTVFGLPYRTTISILEGFMTFIPYFGAFFGAFVGFILIAAENFQQGVIFLILTIVLQQVEANLIYPRVVGSQVGLPGIWVMASVTIGGSLFGLLGMVLAVPITTIIYYTLGDIIDYRNKKRGEDPLTVKNPIMLSQVMRKNIYKKQSEVNEEETIFDKIKPRKNSPKP